MLSQFIPNSEKGKWPDKVRIVSAVLDNFQKIFKRDWNPDSPWEGLSYLQEEMEDFDVKRIGDDVEAAFFYALITQIDFKLLERISSALAEIGQMVQRGPAAKAGIQPVLPSELLEAVDKLDLQDNGKNQLLNNIKTLDESGLLQAEEKLKSLAGWYSEFKIVFTLVSATLSYFTPENAVATFSQFDKAMDLIGPSDTVELNQWSPIFRFLGDSFFGKDAQVRDWATLFLAPEAGELRYFKSDDAIDRLFFIVMLFLAFYDFKNLSGLRKDVLAENCLWWAVCFGVPVEELIKEMLADEPFIDEYVYSSGAMAQHLFNSKTIIFYHEGREKLSVGGFIQKFLAYSQGNDLDGYRQLSYADEKIKEYDWPADIKDHLLKILYLYLHLRECDLIDYREVLSEEGVKKPVYDWKKLIRNEIDEKLLEEIKKYFQLVQRPIKMKMQLILAFESVPWQKEPHLSRVLALNTIYEEIYGFRFSPLVYFDEATAEWKLNKSLPDPYAEPLLDALQDETANWWSKAYVNDILLGEET